MIFNFFFKGPGRRITPTVHRILHPGIRHPWRFQAGGCWLCNQVAKKMFSSGMFQDQSSIKVSDPEPGKKGIYMTATAQRQLEAIIAKDPALEAKLNEIIEKIREDPSL